MHRELQVYRKGLGGAGFWAVALTPQGGVWPGDGMSFPRPASAVTQAPDVCVCAWVRVCTHVYPAWGDAVRAWGLWRDMGSACAAQGSLWCHQVTLGSQVCNLGTASERVSATAHCGSHPPSCSSFLGIPCPHTSVYSPREIKRQNVDPDPGPLHWAVRLQPS